MTINQTIIKKIEHTYRRPLPDDLKKYLLFKYAEEPFPYEYTEQDLYEQLGKLVDQYQAGYLDLRVESPIERLHTNYTYLQQDYVDAMARISKLESDIRYLKILLEKNHIEVSDPGEEVPF